MGRWKLFVCVYRNDGKMLQVDFKKQNEKRDNKESADCATEFWYGT
jgi:hypothetical protein